MAEFFREKNSKSNISNVSWAQKVEKYRWFTWRPKIQNSAQNSRSFQKFSNYFRQFADTQNNSSKYRRILVTVSKFLPSWNEWRFDSTWLTLESHDFPLYCLVMMYASTDCVVRTHHQNNLKTWLTNRSRFFAWNSGLCLVKQSLINSA